VVIPPPRRSAATEPCESPNKCLVRQKKKKNLLVIVESSRNFIYVI